MSNSLDRITSLIDRAKEKEKLGNLEGAQGDCKSALTLIKEEINNAHSKELVEKYKKYFDKVYNYTLTLKGEKKGASSSSSVKHNISLNDIIGHKQAKLEIEENLIQPMKYPDINKKFNIEVSTGLMLYGPPGTGKTTLAKAVASEIEAEFFHVSCKDILDKYVGESEKKLNKIFDDASKTKRAIILFDEFDQIASVSDQSNDTIRRIVALLKELLDGFSSHNNIFIIAATNYPNDIEFGIRRRLIPVYLGLPEKSDIIKLLELKTKSIPVEDGINFSQIADKLDGYSGSDINKLVNYAKRVAANREIENRKSNISGDNKITINDFEESLNRTSKSVSQSDLAIYDKFMKSLN